MSKNIKVSRDKQLYDLIKIINNANDADLTIYFDKTCYLYKNSSNLKILKKVADGLNINLKFEVENGLHKDYIDAVNNDTIEYTDNEVNLDQADIENSANSADKNKVKKGLFTFGFLKFRKKNSSSGVSKNGNPRRRKLLIGFAKIGFFLILVCGILIALWWYMPKATVDIALNSEVLVKLIDVKASTDTNIVSPEDQMIPAVKIELSESDSQSIPTTGEKEIGETAKGEITIFNKTDDEIRIKKGTIVKLIETDKDSLRYETTEETTIPAKDEETTEDVDGTTTETKYGNKKVKIQAITYGDEYNVGKDQKFEIDDFDTDELVGENQDDIDGGSKQTVFIVTQSDMSTLERQLEDFMKEKVLQSLRRKIVDGQVLQESSIKYEVIFSTFDKKLDDESENLTLNMTMKGTGIAYNDNDLDTIMVDLTKTLIPEEYDMNEANPEYEVAAVPGENDNEINIQVKIRSYITPKLNVEKIKDDLTGMSLTQAGEYLNGLSNVKGYVITVRPQLPGVLMTMPHVSDNITINSLK